MKRQILGTAVSCLLLSCSGGSGGPSASEDLDALKGIGSIVVLQRQPRMGGVGDVFQYTSYVAGAKLVKITPPSADGTHEVLCCTGMPGMDGLDIQAFDVSFDARSIVFSGRLAGDPHYGLFILTLTPDGKAAGPPAQLALDPMADAVYPVFSVKDRIIFVSNHSVEEGQPPHQDEYERNTATQLASVSIQGTDVDYGPTNLSHRVAPHMLQDGRVCFTQWDHMQDKNEGNIMCANPDFTTSREGFGKEGKGLVNSYLKLREFDGEPYRLIAIGTSRDRTIQSGKLIDIHMGEMVNGQMLVSEAHSHAVDLTTAVPERDPSAPTVGRYYDAYPVKRLSGSYGDKPLLLVSWGDGPVEEEILGKAGLAPDFGIYLFDSATNQRFPIWNEKDTWEIMAQPLAPRAAITMIDESTMNGFSDKAVLLGGLDADVTSLEQPRTHAVRVRFIEGFTNGVSMFGLTEADGATRIGEVKTFGDNSFAALIPPNIPVHLQTLDTFGVAIKNETSWIQGRPGENRMCGGCHEDRTKNTVIQPGIVQALATRPTDLNKARADRFSMDFSRDKVAGVPWDLALQPILTRSCAGCHDGTNKPGNKSLTLSDAMGNQQTITFNLSGDASDINIGGVMISGFSASHLSLLGLMTAELTEKGITVTGDMPVYVNPSDAAGSLLTQYLNPKEAYPANPASPQLWCQAHDCTARPGGESVQHVVEKGGAPLTEDEIFLFLLMEDMGGQFCSKENLASCQKYN